LHPFSAARESDFSSCFLYLWHYEVVRRTCTPIFQAQNAWVSRSNAFRLLPKVSGANVHWANANHTFLTHKTPQTDTFLRDISPAKLRSTARVWNPQEIFKLVNKVDCRVPCALLKAIVQAFLTTNSFAAGSSTYPCHMACISKSVPRDVISLSNCRPQRLRSTVDETGNSRGRLLSILFLCSSGFSGAQSSPLMVLLSHVASL
jgi:hypothetical protein